MRESAATHQTTSQSATHDMGFCGCAAYVSGRVASSDRACWKRRVKKSRPDCCHRVSAAGGTVQPCFSKCAFASGSFASDQSSTQARFLSRAMSSDVSRSAASLRFACASSPSWKQR